MVRYKSFKSISTIVDFMNERNLTKENVIWIFEKDYSKLGMGTEYVFVWSE